MNRYAIDSITGEKIPVAEYTKAILSETKYQTPRQQILDEASEIVHKDRNANYGNPEDNFRDIAALWSTFKGVTFTPMDVAVMNMMIKIARLKKNPMHHDSIVDIAGYAACAGDIQQSRSQAQGDLSTLGNPFIADPFQSIQSMQSHLGKHNV